ncbi:hypothetical protein [Candidatus Halobonum tyrrellensis]|uniref:DUF8069 domain-containing protein n=1 Tax=Candidatus Halobonum tyrrellensis G22 TaxID=1324957 RepID=V4GN79_9EURY|nr:hypothetical protein [Candidatus Halobonum tyrrellensis]ESP86826.1 hypothetical protein K933_17122 [Candidatus Halobonum tyrrellensis G22]
MDSPTAFDDTSTDHERFETEQLAQDRDAEQSTADLTDGTARRLVTDLVDDGVVTSVAERRVLVHDRSGEAFDSITQLAAFHRGWTAGCDEET